MIDPPRPIDPDGLHHFIDRFLDCALDLPDDVDAAAQIGGVLMRALREALRCLEDVEARNAEIARATDDDRFTDLADIPPLRPEDHAPILERLAKRDAALLRQHGIS